MRFAAESEIADKVWLPGDRDDIPSILQALDLFVLPSLSEGTSNTLLEAMATGLPVIATRIGGNPELVVDGVTGILVPHSNPESIVAAMQTYWNDADLKTRHGHAGRQIAEMRFSMKAMISAYTNVYDSVLTRSAKVVPAQFY
jgi:glycosyltransferase involved in cell wall biosynthesis